MRQEDKTVIKVEDVKEWHPYAKITQVIPDKKKQASKNACRREVDRGE
jgi:hypothetical protein